MGVGLAAGLGFLGDQISFIENSLERTWHNNPNNPESDAYLTKYFKDYDKDISDYFLNKQIDYNKYVMEYQKQLQNTAYQRAIADMKAAGLNPASMAGVNASSAAAPIPQAASMGYHSGAGVSHGLSNGANTHAFASLASSAMMAAVAKDNNAARIMANEIIDNARHAHRLEELRERSEIKEAALSTKDRRNLDWSKSLYYDAKRDYYNDVVLRNKFK